VDVKNGNYLHKNGLLWGLKWYAIIGKLSGIAG